VKADDRNVRAWYNLGLLQKGLGNADAALAAFTRATELLPSDPHAHYFVGLIASQLQQYDKAIPAFTKASRSTRSSCRRSSASRARTSAAARRMTRRRTWIGSRA
jgi:tetratricopeptide (TPR) repeat protein